MYNIKESKIEKTFTNVRNVTSASEFDYLKVFKYADDSYEIISNDGKIDRKMDADSLLLSCYEGCFVVDSYAYDLLPFKKNGKYGIQRLSNGEVILPNEFDEINLNLNISVTKNADSHEGYITDFPYFTAKKNNLYNLYDIKSMKQITTAGYEKIWLLSSNIMLVFKDKYLSFKYFDETDVTKDKIAVNGNILSMMPKNPTGIMINGDEKTKTVEMTIFYGTDWYKDMKSMKYTFNLETKELKLIQNAI